MGETDKSINKATKLLAERRKYEAWLRALDQRRATTPEHVFTRVRGDYAARLDGVIAELARNADALDARVTELTERTQALRDETQAVKDERAEAELRAHVGEIEEGSWEEASRAADRKLEELAAERTAVEEELASIRELLTAARTPAQPMSAVEPPADIAPRAPAPAEAVAPAPSSPVKPAQPADASAEAAEGAAGGDAPVAPPEPAERSSGGFDELAFLRDITGATPEGGAPAAAAAPSGETPADPTPASKQPERPVDDTLGLVLPSDAPAILPGKRPSTGTPMAANVASNSPIVLRPEAARQGKTLKCSECGSMNYPTEWYCERCGAELSAL